MTTTDPLTYAADDSVCAAPLGENRYEYTYATCINGTIVTGWNRNEAWARLRDAGHRNCHFALKAARDNPCAWITVP